MCILRAIDNEKKYASLLSCHFVKYTTTCKNIIPLNQK